MDHVGGRILNVCVVVSTWVNADGQREILDMDVGASGVELVTSDAHQGLKSAIAAVFAGANWQRCRTYFMSNLLTLIAERYERRSLGITSNLVFSEWELIFANPMATAAAIDRVVHHSVILEFDVPSYRTNAAQQRVQAEEVNRQI